MRGLPPKEIWLTAVGGIPGECLRLLVALVCAAAGRGPRSLKQVAGKVRVCGGPFGNVSIQYKKLSLGKRQTW